MRIETILTPDMLRLILVGGVGLLLVVILGGGLLFLRNLKQMRRMLLEGNEVYRKAQHDLVQFQVATHDHIQQLRTGQTSMQEHVQRLEVAQASTQATVAATQRETQRFVQDMQSLHQASQALMLELKTLHGTSQALMTDWQKETAHLSRALRTTYHQGNWGEYELRRVVELAGMVAHCDFEIQPSLSNGQKPDMLIYMHNNRFIAVDAKAPSQAYLEAMSCEDEGLRTTKLKAYARHVKEMMHQLASREYWKHLQPSPAVVILFLPNEAMFRAALEYDFSLLESATDKHVFLASPMTLIALLKMIAYGWSQEVRAQNVQHIVDQSNALHQELERWVRQWQPLKKAIQTTSSEFDRVAAHYEAHVLPLIRAIGTLDSTLPVKDKAFELKPLLTAPTPQEEAEERFRLHEVGNTVGSWFARITEQLTK